MAMNDRGEKIIHLAREMLRSDAVFDVEPAAPKTTISFKVLCLATALTAVSSYAITEASYQNHRPLTRYEKTELNALIFYAARLKGIREDDLRREVEQAVGIGSFDDLTMREFPTARRLLQDKVQ
jgi:hypothetical protein